VSEQAFARAREAREKLAARLVHHPDVSMVDIGLHEAGAGLVVRVHVRGEAASLPDVPAELDGIPVRVVRGDYHPEEAQE
jgi:hypothetical protein